MLSPDGCWWWDWDGMEWLPALSPDGRWQWTGQTWRLIDASRQGARTAPGNRALGYARVGILGLALPPLAVVFGPAAVVIGFRARAQVTGRLGLVGGALVLVCGLYMTAWLVLLFGFGIDIGLART